MFPGTHKSHSNLSELIGFRQRIILPIAFKLNTRLTKMTRLREWRTGSTSMMYLLYYVLTHVRQPFGNNS